MSYIFTSCKGLNGSFDLDLSGPNSLIENVGLQLYLDLSGTSLLVCGNAYDLTNVDVQTCSLPESACECTSSWLSSCTAELTCGPASGPQLAPAPTSNDCTVYQATASSSPRAIPEEIINSIPTRPIAPPIGCNSAPPTPSTGFQCINGQWVTNSSVSGGLVISPNSNIVILGNASFSGSIVFNGLSSSINVIGCIFSASGTLVEVSVSKEDIEKILKDGKGSSYSVVLIQGSSNLDCPGSANLANTKLNAKKSFSGCRKVKAKKFSQSTQTKLIATFTVDNTVCHVIIIVPVVVGVVLILALIGAIIIWKIRMAQNSKSVSDLSG